MIYIFFFVIVLQKAGHHMEHTMLASYVSILIGYLVKGNEEYENVILPLLRKGNFEEIIKVLIRYNVESFLCSIGDNAANVQKALSIVIEKYPH